LSRSGGTLALASIGLAIAVLAVWQLGERHRRSVGHTERVLFLKMLEPVTLTNCTLRRFGAAHDGGYLMCDNLSEGIQAAYSYGIGASDELGCSVSKRYRVPVHQYDCFDPTRPTCEGGTFVFHDQCIGPRFERDKDRRVFDTLQNQISKNRDAGKRLIVKMDIEGAEWDSLLVTPAAVLARVDQMPMELHMWQGVTGRHFRVLRKLKKHFHVVNLNFNNQACLQRMEPLPAWAFQVLLVNRRIGALDKAAPTPAPFSPLNAPDNPLLPDCQLSSSRR
jgi:hypothetical protein